MNQSSKQASFIVASLPGAIVHTTEAGVCIWADVSFKGEDFVIQITPKDGVGVSKKDLSGDTDLSGHDKAFANLTAAIEYIKCNVS
jgi:hypothetical protein